mmetsp:Transcript_28202/g.77858  ORF Transcript_28202/g.77858 Transcript_28202/m.77858 type:complete len:83 (+) Transcript_28202:921-1169(+)
MDSLMPALDELSDLMVHTGQKWLISRVVLVDRLAFQICMGPRNWFEQLAVTSALPDEWNFPACHDQVHVPSYIFARYRLFDD